MFKKLLSSGLACLVLMTGSLRQVSAFSREGKQADSIEKVKADVAKLGTGTKARVEVKLRDKTKLKGYISEVANDYFVVTDAKTGATTTVPYSQVRQVKGSGLSHGVKTALGIALGVGLLFVVAIIYTAFVDN